MPTVYRSGNILRGVWLSVFLAVMGCHSAARVAHSDANLCVGSSAYRSLVNLRAEGVLKSGALTTRPISRAEAARLVLEAEEQVDAPPAAAASLGILRREFAQETADLSSGGEVWYFKPLERVRLMYLFLDGETDIENFQGRPYTEHNNTWLGMSSRFSAGALSGYVDVEGSWLEDADGAGDLLDVRVNEGYIRLSNGTCFTEVGRQSLWWGPCRHGALLLSNNARPFDMVRLGNESPVLLPGCLSKLGPVHFELFWTRLERDRDTPEPYLAGMRLTFMPTPNVELGASRTAMFGGEGRPVDIHTIWDVLTVREENEPGGPGNQLASVDWRITLPFPVQPFEFYGEFGGEDEAAGMFSRNAIIAGFYFPRIGPTPLFDFRIEYADTYMAGHSGNSRIWYTHSVYTSGYTYDGRVIGHHAGTDAQDLYLELGINPFPRLRFWAGYDLEYRELSLPFPERHQEYSIGCEWRGRRGPALKVTYAWEEVENYNFTDGADVDGERLMLEAAVRF